MRIAFLIWILMAVSVSGCLRTRAQLRADSEDDGRPIPVQPAQDVQPQGRYVFDEVKEEMTRLQGRIEDLDRAQQELSSKIGSGATQKDTIRALEIRIAQLEQNQSTLTDDLKKIRVTHSDPEDFFKKAKHHIRDGEYPEAIDALSAYLKSPKVKKQEEALMMRGESYYKLKDFKKAIVDFSKFPEKYRHSSVMPQALMKIALSFEGLGMKEEARGFYQELLQKFPKSPEAKKARKKVK